MASTAYGIHGWRGVVPEARAGLHVRCAIRCTPACDAEEACCMYENEIVEYSPVCVEVFVRFARA